MATPPLDGRAVIVPVDWAGAADLARRLAAAGATVVLVGADGDAAGRLAAAVEAAGTGRPAVFVTTGSGGDLDALVGLVADLFPTKPQPEGRDQHQIEDES